eukprot:g6937.t1
MAWRALDIDENGQVFAEGEGEVSPMMQLLMGRVTALLEQKQMEKVAEKEAESQEMEVDPGKLVLNLEDQLFAEHKKVYAKKYSKEKETALPEAIMKGLYFANDSKAFEQARKDKDIVPVETAEGKTFWAFTSYVKGQEQGKEETQDLSSKKKVDKRQAELLGDCFNQIGWSWKYTDKDCRVLGDGRIPAAIGNLVQQATQSQQRLGKEAMTMIKAWKGDKEDERLAKLKKGHTLIQLNLAKLSHMLEFQELPDDLPPTKENLDKIMKDMAVHTQEYNELVETTRGWLKARKN